MESISVQIDHGDHIYNLNYAHEDKDYLDFDNLDRSFDFDNVRDCKERTMQKLMELFVVMEIQHRAYYKL